MNIAITFRQMEATEAVKVYATDKVAKLQKFMKQPMKAQVTLSCQHQQHRAEVDIRGGRREVSTHTRHRRTCTPRLTGSSTRSSARSALPGRSPRPTARGRSAHRSACCRRPKSRGSPRPRKPIHRGTRRSSPTSFALTRRRQRPAAFGPVCPRGCASRASMTLTDLLSADRVAIRSSQNGAQPLDKQGAITILAGLLGRAEVSTQTRQAARASTRTRSSASCSSASGSSPRPSARGSPSRTARWPSSTSQVAALLIVPDGIDFAAIDERAGQHHLRRHRPQARHRRAPEDARAGLSPAQESGLPRAPRRFAAIRAPPSRSSRARRGSRDDEARGRRLGRSGARRRPSAAAPRPRS